MYPFHQIFINIRTIMPPPNAFKSLMPNMRTNRNAFLLRFSLLFMQILPITSNDSHFRKYRKLHKQQTISNFCGQSEVKCTYMRPHVAWAQHMTFIAATNNFSRQVIANLPWFYSARWQFEFIASNTKISAEKTNIGERQTQLVARFEKQFFFS